MNTDKKLVLNKEESVVFSEILSTEQKCLVNEYDDITGKTPGRMRKKNISMLNDIIKKWSATQQRIAGTTFIDLSAIEKCTIELSDQEKEYCRALLTRTQSVMRKELGNAGQPYTGVYGTMNKTAETIEDIIRKL